MQLNLIETDHIFIIYIFLLFAHRNTREKTV